MRGGVVCAISSLLLKNFPNKAGRCVAKASHKIKIKNKTATTEIKEPNLAKTFQVA